MDINSMIDTVFPNGLRIEGAYELLRPVAIYVIGMVAYAVFIFKFYRFVASRDMFDLDLSKYERSRYPWLRRILHVLMYILQYLIIFPTFAFFWFAVLTVILALLSRDREITEVFVIALATVSAIRVVSYYSEDLSRDVAKILPFAVLGLFLVDASFFEIGTSLDVLSDAEDHRESILYYLVAIVLLEFVMRIILGAGTLIAGLRKAPTEDSREGEEDVDRCHSPVCGDPEDKIDPVDENHKRSKPDEETNSPDGPQSSSPQ